MCMNRDQLEELRVKPLPASSASKRTLVPALNMHLWYAPHLELTNGVVLKGTTLVAIRSSDKLLLPPRRKFVISHWFPLLLRSRTVLLPRCL
ncbi:F-box protein At4g18380 [Linum grandiflorum]